MANLALPQIALLTYEDKYKITLSDQTHKCSFTLPKEGNGDTDWLVRLLVAYMDLPAGYYWLEVKHPQADPPKE